MMDRVELNEHLFKIQVASDDDWDQILFDFLERPYPTLEAQNN